MLDDKNYYKTINNSIKTLKLQRFFHENFVFQNFLDKLDETETIFHTNCNKLIDKEKFISAKLSSIPVGILAYEMFENFVIKDPTNLVSNYVSPFNINK